MGSLRKCLHTFRLESEKMMAFTALNFAASLKVGPGACCGSGSVLFGWTRQNGFNFSVGLPEKSTKKGGYPQKDTP